MTTQARPISETFAQALANSIAQTTAAEASSLAPTGTADVKPSQRPVSEIIPLADQKYKTPESRSKSD